MSQLALDLLSTFPPRLENFVPGPNDETLALLQALAAGATGAPGERQVHLWGPSGSGKSHLLQALAQYLGPAARLIDPRDPPSAYGFTGADGPTPEPAPAPAANAAVGPGVAPVPGSVPALPAARLPRQAELPLVLEPAPAPIRPLTQEARQPGPAPDSAPPPPPRLWLVDDVQALDGPRQEALFGLINRVREQSGMALVTAGDAPPLGLALREDLRTRLGWGRVQGLKPLTDDDKALALLALAARRGVAMSPEVPAWLLAHSSRDMRALIALFDALDRHALARQRAITLPLLRDYLQREL